MNKPAGYPSLRRRLLANLPPEMAESLSELQLTAIEHALGGDGWNRHPLDVRLSIPLPWRRFYLVILGGPERRSKERLAYERARRGTKRIMDLLAVGLFVLFLVPMLLGSYRIIALALSGN